MTLVRTRVLIINRQVQVAVDLKQSLERTGEFEASAFTTVDAAIDTLSTRPYHVALVDLSNSTMPPVDVILQLRAVQPDIAIIASPDTPTVRSLERDLQLQGRVGLPCSLRELIPVIQGAARDVIDSLPDTAAAPAVRVDSETQAMPEVSNEPPATPDFSSLDSVLVRMGGLDVLGSDTLDLDTGETVLGESGEQSSVVEFVLNGSLSRLPDDAALDDADSGDDLSDTPDRKPAIEHMAVAESLPPGLEDSGTIRDLRTGVNRVNLNQVVQALQQGRPLPLPPLPEDDDGDSDEDTTPGEAETALPEARPPANTAEAVLRTTLGDPASRTMGLDELLDTLARQFPDPEDTGGVKPLPSWVEQTHRYVDEPDFLKGPLPPPEVDFGSDDDGSYAVTQPGAAVQAELEGQPQDMETEYMPAESDADGESQPDDVSDAIRTPDVAEAAPPAEVPTGPPQTTEPVTPPAEPRVVTDVPPPSEPRPPRRITPVPTGAPPVTLGTDDPDPKVARLALGLTQFSVESTVQACLLARGGEVIAYAGSLPLEDIEAIQQIVGHDWEAQSVQARIRFVTPPSSDREFMLYTRRTDAGFTLSMVFLAETHLRSIRRQARLLLDALRNVQERIAAPTAPDDEHELEQLERIAGEQEQEALEDTGLIRAQLGEPPAATLDEALQPVKAVTLAPQTFVWMLADPEQALTQDVARAIVSDLDRQLASQGWHVEQLQVYEDFVYLLADVPADRPTQEIVRELKQQTAQIAGRANPALSVDDLWGDNYGVLTPGRELGVEEMQRFVNFVRLR